jgi:hypothetical protein
MRRYNFKIIIFGYIFANSQFASLASADTELSKMRDCTEIELEAVIDQDVSREENLARLSQQFFQSVNKIDYCDREPRNDDTVPSTPDNSSISANAEAEETTTGNDETSAATSKEIENTNNQEINMSSGGTSTDQTTIPPSAQYDASSGNAIASGTLVGTNFEQNITELAVPSASNMMGNTPQPTSVNAGVDGTERNGAEQDLRLTNGKTPDDIPDAKNDSVFEAQIRAAAIAETDPDTKKNLWNEYRRYKGLPEQK